MRKGRFLIIVSILLLSLAITAVASAAPDRVQLVPYGDLIVEKITVSNPVREGDKVGAQSIFSITVKNIGKGSTDAADIKMTLTASSGGPAPAAMSGISRCPALQPGQAIGFAWPGYDNATWPAGQYTLTVEADSSQVVPEDNENNNKKSFDFAVLAPLAGTQAKKGPGSLTLPDSLSLTAPAKGAMWALSTTQKITWQNSGSQKTGTAKILLLKGEQVFRIISESASLPQGEYLWTIPADIPEGNYRLRIISNVNDAVRGTSGEFNLYKFIGTGSGGASTGGNTDQEPPLLNLTSPLGGGTYSVGQKLPIAWQSDYKEGYQYATVTLEKQGGGSLLISDNAKLSDRSYQWTVPNDPQYNGKWKLKIAINGTSYSDISSDYFTLFVPVKEKISVTMIKPTTGDSWKAGEIHDVVWEYGGNSGNEEFSVEIDSVGHNSKYNNKEIATRIPGSGQKQTVFQWTIPVDIEPGQYRIHIYAHKALSGDNGEVFTIRSGKDQISDTGGKQPETASQAELQAKLNPLSVTSPSANSIWEFGSTQKISWHSKVTTGGTAKIVLLKGNMPMDPPVKTAVPLTAGDHSALWVINGEQYPPGKYTLRVVSTSDPALYGDSKEFALVPKTGISLTSPHGGSYQNEQEVPIRWNYTGAADNKLKITIEKQGGGSKIVKDNLPAGSGAFTWTVPKRESGISWEYSGNWKIKLEVKETHHTALSDNYLTIDAGIKPELKLVGPLAGTVWKVGSQQKVTFSYKGYVGPVVNISLVKGGKQVLFKQVHEIELNSGGGEYSWIIQQLPQGLASGSDYEITITGSVLGLDKKISSGLFTIQGEFPHLKPGGIGKQLPK